ncbi:MAG TPA: hypothetical protein VFR93_11705 [Candidatus Limnocylindrales bacterium]|nr:hypothetical protein [Candidatus Limnocylindrales bacterium]
MNGVGRARPSEEELVELLERRAGRTKVDPALIDRVAAAASLENRVGSSRTWPAWRSIGRARRTAGALLAAVAVVSLVGAALFVGGGQRPAATASPSQSATTQTVTGYRFTSVDFLRYLREQPDAFVGHTVLVDGTLGDIMASCVRAAFDCPPQAFGNAAGPSDPLVLPIDQAARDSVREGASGTFAIQVRSASDLRLLGRVQAASSGDAWQPSALRDRAAAGPELYLVDGYLGGVNEGCPLFLPNGPSWCPTAWISDTPDASGGPRSVPSGALRIPADLPLSGGVPVRHPQVQVLLRSFPSTSCAADPTCAAAGAANAWETVSTVEPVTVDVSASPARSDATGVQPTVLDAASLPDVLPNVPVGSTILVHGRLVDTSGKSCAGGRNCSVAGFESIVDKVGVLAGGDMPTLPVSGTFAVSVVDAAHVRYVDAIVLNGDHIAWHPLELGRYGPPSGTAYVVAGWLVPGHRAAAACPGGSSQKTVEICSGRPPQLVEDEAAARTVLGGQKVESLLLRSVADGISGAAAADARQGFFVVRASTKTCNDLGGQQVPDCFIPPNPGVDLFVDARLDPVAPVATPSPSRPASPSIGPSPTGPPSATPAPPSPAVSQLVDRLPADALLHYLDADPRPFVGRTVLVDGTLSVVPVPCPTSASGPASGPCPPFAFGSSGADGPLVYPATAAAASELASGRVTGTFAIRIDSAKRLVDLGRVTLSADGDPWQPTELRQLAPAMGLYVVDGYLDRSSSTYFCAWQPADRPAWCPPAWISDHAGSSPPSGVTIPDDAIQIPAGAGGAGGNTGLPRHGLYLLAPAPTNLCGAPGTSSGDCTPWSRWTVAGRIDPVALGAQDPSSTAGPASGAPN